MRTGRFAFEKRKVRAGFLGLRSETVMTLLVETYGPAMHGGYEISWMEGTEHDAWRVQHALRGSMRTNPDTVEIEELVESIIAEKAA